MTETTPDATSEDFVGTFNVEKALLFVDFPVKGAVIYDEALLTAKEWQSSQLTTQPAVDNHSEISEMDPIQGGIMGLRINTNVEAFNAYRNLTTTSNGLSKSLERLSSGMRINRAADDAAGLSISENLKSQINGFQRASSNAQDGISLLQTAEGALNETTNLLQRVRDLAVQASNTGASDQAARDAIGKEVTQALNEIDRISSATVFGNKNLLDNSQSSGFTFHVGYNGQSYNQINVKIGAMSSGALKLSGLAATITGTNAAAALASIDAAITNVSGVRSDIGSYQNRLESTITNLGVAVENLSASRSRIADTDMASEMTNFSKLQILQQAGTAMLGQANSLQQGVLSLLRG
jgi:flagellin